jgi:hypothetical protein
MRPVLALVLVDHWVVCPTVEYSSRCQPRAHCKLRLDCSSGIQPLRFAGCSLSYRTCHPVSRPCESAISCTKFRGLDIRPSKKGDNADEDLMTNHECNRERELPQEYHRMLQLRSTYGESGFLCDILDPIFVLILGYMPEYAAHLTGVSACLGSISARSLDKVNICCHG